MATVGIKGLTMQSYLDINCIVNRHNMYSDTCCRHSLAMCLFVVCYYLSSKCVYQNQRENERQGEREREREGLYKYFTAYVYDLLSSRLTVYVKHGCARPDGQLCFD